MRTNTLRMPLVACALMALAGCSASPESTVERFYRAVAEGEITEARGYISQQVVGMLGEEKLATTLSAETQRVQACGGITDIEGELQAGAEGRFGTVVVKYETCPEKRENLKLVKEDGDWKLGASK